MEFLAAGSLLWNFIATGFVHLNCCNQATLKTTPLEGQCIMKERIMKERPASEG
jgi:hypothetical protein